MFGAFNTFGKLGSPAGGKTLLAQIQSMGASFIGIPSLSNYQDSAGTALVTQPGGGAADPPVGLALDLSQGAALGPELIIDGDFSASPGPWVIGGSWTIAGGVASAVNEGVVLYQLTPTLMVGAWYAVAWTISNYSAGVCRVNAGNNISSAWESGNGVRSQIIQADASGACGISCAGFTGSIDNISVREIPGNHALQSTSTARPKLSARVNLLTYTEDFSNAVWTTTDLSTKSKNAVDHNGQPNSAWTLSDTSASAVGYIFQSVTFEAKTYTSSVYVARTSGALSAFPVLSARLSSPASRCGVFIDTTNVTVTPWTTYPVEFLSCTAQITEISDTHFRVSITYTMPSAGYGVVMLAPAWSNSNTGNGAVVNSAQGTAVFDSIQTQLGSTATAYQRVTDANTYDYSGFPLIHQFDAVDDAHVITFGSSLGSDCTVVTANRGTTPTIQTGQTIGTSYTITTTHAGKLIFPRALTAAETATVTAWATRQGAL